MTDNKGILVYAQITRNNEVLDVVSELASEAQKLSAKLNGEKLEAVLLTNGQNLDNIKNSLEAFDKVYILKNEKFSKYKINKFFTPPAQERSWPSSFCLQPQILPAHRHRSSSQS